MIERFNFYDAYGYFLPGFTLLALIWLPLGLIGGWVPAAQLSSALAVIPLAYIAGHVLQGLAVNALPSKLRNDRFPSDFLLDAADTTFSPSFKRRVAVQIKSHFDIDVGLSATQSQDLSRDRQDAFFLCRSMLIKEKGVSYGEQFQGMYALMRGLTVAFGAGFVYHSGWALSNLLPYNWVSKIAIGFVVLGLAAAVVNELAVLGLALVPLANAIQKALHVSPAMLTLSSVGLALLGLAFRLGHGKPNTLEPLAATAVGSFCGPKVLGSLSILR